jgi:hypothetical protein
MNLTLDADTEIVIVPAQTITSREVKILCISDSPEARTVTIDIADAADTNNDQPVRFTLWESEAYDAFADFAWTRTDIENRLREMLGSV